MIGVEIRAIVRRVLLGGMRKALGYRFHERLPWSEMASWQFVVAFRAAAKRRTRMHDDRTGMMATPPGLRSRPE